MSNHARKACTSMESLVDERDIILKKTKQQTVVPSGGKGEGSFECKVFFSGSEKVDVLLRMV